MLASTLLSLCAAVQIGVGYDANIDRFDRGTFKSAMYSFEDVADLADFKAEKSKLAQSDLHFKQDAKSLAWEFQSGGSFSIINPEALKLAANRAGGLKFWVYSPTVQPGALKIEGMANGRAVWTFEVKLGFKGWRAVWLMPSQDAKIIEKKMPPLDAIRFIAATAKPGTLFFDRFELIDNVLWVRESDFQLAINPPKSGGVDQTLATYRQKPPADNTPPSSAELAATKVVGERLRNWINGSPEADRHPEVAKLRASMIADAPKVLKEFDQFKIVRHPDGRVTGQPLFGTLHAGAPQVQKLIDAVLLPMTLLYCYPGSPAKPNPYYQSPELLQKIILGLDHTNDQGWAEGSSMGSCYGVVLGQSGYNLILFLLRDELAKAGILERELKTLRYYSHFNELFTPTEASADKLRSVMFFQLLVIASLNDPAEQTRFLRLYSAAKNRQLATMRGNAAFVKPDGTVYHHSAPYWMGYGMNGLEMASRLGYFLRETPFALNTESRDNLKKAFLASRFVSQKYDFPISLNGRWPLWTGGLAQGVMGFGYTAQLFNPADPELAAAWKRLGDFNEEVI
ncbi:MAG: chondroitinase family polysaccharide lyase, partial [Victivallaceae bacterium]